MKKCTAKAILVAALAVACAFALAACGGQSNSAQSGNKVVVGYDQSNFDADEGQSFSDSFPYVSFIKSALGELGWDVEFKGIDFADVEKSINDGTIDCYWNSYTIQGREDMYAWSEAYLAARPVLVYKKDSGVFGDTQPGSAIDSVSDLPSNKVIAVKADTVTYADLPSDQKAIVDSIGTLKEYPGLVQCKEALEKGEADLVLTEADIMSPLFVDAAYSRITLDVTGKNSYGVAFKKGNEVKADAIAGALRKVYTSGALKEDFMAYFKNGGLSDEETKLAWNSFDGCWLLKEKVTIGYATSNYGTEEGQGFEDSVYCNFFIKPTLEKLAWDAEFKGVEYADIEKSINDGTIDCFWDSYTIQGREDMYAWSDAYQEATPVLVWKLADGTFGTKEARCEMDSLSSLPSGLTIGVKAGTVTYADMPDDQKATIDSIGTFKEYPGLAQCKEALDKGEVDVVLTEAALTTPLFSDLGTYGGVWFAQSDTNHYGVAFKKGNEDKAKALGQALKKVYADSTPKALYLDQLRNNGFSEAAAEQIWDAFDKRWLLK